MRILLFIINCSEETIAEVSFTELSNNISLGIKIKKNLGIDEFLMPTILKTAILEIEQQFESNYLSIFPVKNQSMMFQNLLELLDFEKVKEGSEYIRPVKWQDGQSVGKLKNKLKQITQTALLEGRGYVIDASNFDHKELSNLSDEYNQVAWGLTNWAKHDDLADDEIRIVEKFIKGKVGLEVGAGSGRVTRHISRYLEKLYPIDYLEEIVSKHILCM